MACQRPSAIEMGTMRFWHAVQALRMFRHTDNIVHLDNCFIFCFILWLKDTSDPLREDLKQKYAVKFTLISVNFHWEFSFLVSTFLGLAVGEKKQTKNLKNKPSVSTSEQCFYCRNSWFVDVLKLVSFWLQNSMVFSYRYYCKQEQDTLFKKEMEEEHLSNRAY